MKKSEAKTNGNKQNEAKKSKRNKIEQNFGGIFRVFLLMYVIQHCFICCPSDSTVSEDAGNATLALTARRSNHLARSHPPS
jgi:hypothetical protein